ncbi:MAG: heterodisulfide reductase, partial [Pseudomonadota bacterium]
MIHLKNTDPHFRHHLLQQPGGEKITACFTCATCVASCPITAVNETFNPLRIIRMALYGLKKEVLES